MFIYTTRFEGVSAFTTARKAVESCIGSGYADMTDYGSIPPGADYKEYQVEVTPENVAKIITFINKKGSVNIMHGGYDHTVIDKVRVR